MIHPFLWMFVACQDVGNCVEGVAYDIDKVQSKRKLETGKRKLETELLETESEEPGVEAQNKTRAPARSTAGSSGSEKALAVEQADEYIHHMKWAFDDKREADDVKKLTPEHQFKYPLESKPLGADHATFQKQICDWLGDKFTTEQKNNFQVSTNKLTMTVNPDFNFQETTLYSLPDKNAAETRKGTYLLFSGQSFDLSDEEANPQKLFEHWSEFTRHQWDRERDGWTFTCEQPDQYFAVDLKQEVGSFKWYDGEAFAYTPPTSEQNDGNAHASYTSGTRGEACITYCDSSDEILSAGDFLCVPICIEVGNQTSSQ